MKEIVYEAQYHWSSISPSHELKSACCEDMNRFLTNEHKASSSQSMIIFTQLDFIPGVGFKVCPFCKQEITFKEIEKQ